jgi:NADH-quinone oxidoreductase subunit J
VDFAEFRQGFLQYLPIGGLVGMILLVELILVLGGMLVSPEAVSSAASKAVKCATKSLAGLLPARSESNATGTVN